MFTKEHYIAVAKVLKQNKTTLLYTERVLFRKVVLDFVELFKENPKFNEEKFLNEIYGKEKDK